MWTERKLSTFLIQTPLLNSGSTYVKPHVIGFVLTFYTLTVSRVGLHTPPLALTLARSAHTLDARRLLAFEILSNVLLEP